MEMENELRDWVWSVAAKKVIMRLVIVGVSYLASLGTDKIGINIDQQALQQSTFVASYAGIELARNWAKRRYGEKYPSVSKFL